MLYLCTQKRARKDKRHEKEVFVFEPDHLGISKPAYPCRDHHGGACADIARNIITSRGLHVRSSEIGATADLEATKMNLNTMRAETSGKASFQGSKASLKAFYDIDDEAYDLSRTDLRFATDTATSPFNLQRSTVVLLRNELNAATGNIRRTTAPL